VRVFENRVLRRIFGPKSDAVTGGWSKFPRKEFKICHFSLNMIRMTKSRKVRWTGHVARMEPKANAYMIRVEMTEGKRPLGRHRRRWEDNNEMNLSEVG
jgi:hypothetical protein